MFLDSSPMAHWKEHPEVEWIFNKGYFWDDPVCTSCGKPIEDGDTILCLPSDSDPRVCLCESCISNNTYVNRS